MAPARADPNGGHTGPARWTAGGAKTKQGNRQRSEGTTPREASSRGTHGRGPVTGLDAWLQCSVTIHRMYNKQASSK